MVYDKNNRFNVKSPNISIAIQFTILANSSYICCLLKQLEKNEIDICAFVFLEDKYNKVKFKCVIDNGNNKSLDKLNIMRSILDNDGIEYSETKVVKVSSYTNSNDLSSQFCVLLQNLSVYSFYLGTDESVIFETCCPTKTIQVLSSLF